MAHDPSSGSTATAVELRALLARTPVLTLAVAESVTCGRVQAAIGAVSGASAYFLGGITAYSLEQKVRHLGVNAVAATAVHCVSPDVAAEMAIGACRLFGSDLGLATTGYAELDTARGVENAGGFWAVARMRGTDAAVLRRGYVDGRGLGRIDVQEAVACHVLGALLDFVRLFRTAEDQSRFV